MLYWTPAHTACSFKLHPVLKPHQRTTFNYDYMQTHSRPAPSLFQGSVSSSAANLSCWRVIELAALCQTSLSDPCSGSAQRSEAGVFSQRQSHVCFSQSYSVCSRFLDIIRDWWLNTDWTGAKRAVRGLLWERKMMSDGKDRDFLRLGQS